MKSLALLALVACVLMFSGCNHQAEKPIHWEYKILDFDGDARNLFNKMGGQSWELVSISTKGNRSVQLQQWGSVFRGTVFEANYYQAVFKRPLP